MAKVIGKATVIRVEQHPDEGEKRELMGEVKAFHVDDKTVGVDPLEVVEVALKGEAERKQARVGWNRRFAESYDRIFGNKGKSGRN